MVEPKVQGRVELEARRKTWFTRQSPQYLYYGQSQAIMGYPILDYSITDIGGHHLLHSSPTRILHRLVVSRLVALIAVGLNS